MTADSPAVAEARRVARLRRLAGDVDVAEVLDGLLAELAETCAVVEAARRWRATCSDWEFDLMPDWVPLREALAALDASRTAPSQARAEDLSATDPPEAPASLHGALQGQHGASTIEPWGTRSAPECHRGRDGASGVMRGEGPDGSEAPGPAERLRRAADLVEQRAAAATPGPWQPEWTYARARVQAVFVECDGEDCGHDGYGHQDGTCAIGAMHDDSDNRWSILVGPQIAPALATLLRTAADECGRYVGALEALPRQKPEDTASCVAGRFGEALALADAILAGENR